MKLGRAVEISPSVFREQFTSCDKISQAASADSLLLSTLKQKRYIGSENTASKTLFTKNKNRYRCTLIVWFFFCFTFWNGMSKNPQNTLYHKVSLTLNINQELTQDDLLRKCRSLGRLWLKRKPWSRNSTYSTQSATDPRQFFFCSNTCWKILFNNPILPYLLMNFQAFSLDRVRVSVISTCLWFPLLLSISCNPEFILQCWSTIQGTCLTNDQWNGIWNPSKTSTDRRQTLEGDSNTTINLYYPDTDKNPAKNLVITSLPLTPHQAVIRQRCLSYPHVDDSCIEPARSQKQTTTMSSLLQTHFLSKSATQEMHMQPWHFHSILPKQSDT